MTNLSVESAAESFCIQIQSDFSLLNLEYSPPSSWTGHAPFLKWLLKQIKPAYYVELGVHFGFSYFVACETIKNESLRTKAFGIDTWQGDSHVGIIDKKVLETVTEQNLKYDFSELIQSTFDEALLSFPDQSIDLLHIDGGHTYEEVVADFESWLPKMSDNGVILFHDIGVRIDNFGVYKFWEELRRKYESFSFSHQYGLGILFVGKIPEELKVLHEISKSEAWKLIEQAFSYLASKLNDRTCYALDQVVSEKNEMFVMNDKLSMKKQSLMDEITIIDSQLSKLKSNFETELNLMKNEKIILTTNVEELSFQLQIIRNSRFYKAMKIYSKVISYLR